MAEAPARVLPRDRGATSAPPPMGPPRRPTLTDYLCAAPVAAASTVNLWKVQSIRNLVPVDLTLLTLLSVSILILGTILTAPRKVRGIGPVLWFLACLLPGLALSSFTQPYSVQKSLQLFTFVPVLIAGGILLINSPGRRNAFRHTLILLGLAVAVGLEVGGTSGAEAAGRVALEDGNTIALARMCALAVVCLLVPSPLRRPSPAAFLGAAFCLHATFSTGSRGPLVAALVGITAAVVFAADTERAGWQGRAVRRVLPLAAGMALLWSLAKGTRIVSAFGGESDIVRVQLLGESFRLFVRDPWGLGWGDLVLSMSLGLRHDDQGWAQYPHNILAEAMVEGGIVALVGLLWFTWVTFSALWRYARCNHATMLALFVTAYGSALTSSDLTSNRVLWALFGIGLAVRAEQDRAKRGQLAPPRALKRSRSLDRAR